MQKPFTFKAYDFTLAAGGVQAIMAGGEYFRILSATGALDVAVEGKGTMPDLLPGQAVKGLPFDRLILKDKTGAPNTGYILVSSSEFVDNRMFGTFDLSPTTLAALESIDLNAATIAQLMLAPTVSFANNAGGVAATATTVVTPAANVNGLWVTEAQIGCYNSAGAQGIALLAKSSAPTSTADGQLVLHTGALSAVFNVAQLNKPVFVAAGLGLYFYNVLTDSAHSGLMRAARCKLL